MKFSIVKHLLCNLKIINLIDEYYSLCHRRFAKREFHKTQPENHVSKIVSNRIGCKF